MEEEEEEKERLYTNSSSSKDCQGITELASTRLSYQTEQLLPSGPRILNLLKPDLQPELIDKTSCNTEQKSGTSQE